MGHYSADYEYSENRAANAREATAAKVRAEVREKRTKMLHKVSALYKELDRALVPDRFVHSVEDLENWLVIQTAE